MNGWVYAKLAFVYVLWVRACVRVCIRTYVRVCLVYINCVSVLSDSMVFCRWLILLLLLQYVLMLFIYLLLLLLLFYLYSLLILFIMNDDDIFNVFNFYAAADVIRLQL